MKSTNIIKKNGGVWLKSKAEIGAKKLKMDKWIRRMDWYIIKKFLGTYFFSIALIISIAVVFDVNEQIDKFITNKAPIEAIIFDYYMNFIHYFSSYCFVSGCI